MHIPTHILSGWCVASFLPRLTPRERFFAMIAASIADLDGLGIFLGQEAYWDYHHVVGHNLVFSLFIAVVLTRFSSHRRTVCLLYLALTHLHLLLDYFGSGPGWGIHYLWPLQPLVFKTDYAWELFSWQNIVTGYALVAWAVVIAILQQRSPLEFPMPQLDRKLLVGLNRIVRRSPSGV